MMPTSSSNSSNNSNDDSKDIANSGFDNCKSFFIFLVVLWHTAHLGILETVLLKGKPSDGTDETLHTNEGNFYDRQQFYHPHWNQWIITLVIRYWHWTEKLAVPGFAFLSGYFGKGYLGTWAHSDEISLEDVERDRTKERRRWEKTILTLVVAPLLWQFLQFGLTYLLSGLYDGTWKAHWTLLENKEKGFPTQLPLWDFVETWYLFALLIWRMITALFLPRLRQTHQFPLLVSLFLSFLSVHTYREAKEGEFSMQIRLFFFFPFYVAGLYWDKTHWTRIPAFAGRFLPGIDDPERISRYVGGLGMILTLTICEVFSFGYEGWIYQIDNYQWRPHLELLLQYIVSGAGVISVILVFKTIRTPLLPFQHASSTLAIYMVHWPWADFFSVGICRYLITAQVMKTSVMQYTFTRMPPIAALLVSHLVCYMVCVALGSRWAWEKAGIRHLCEPQWAARFLLASSSNREDTGNGNGNGMLPLSISPARIALSISKSSSREE